MANKPELLLAYVAFVTQGYTHRLSISIAICSIKKCGSKGGASMQTVKKKGCHIIPCFNNGIIGV
jgi:hypothetical protein